MSKEIRNSQIEDTNIKLSQVNDLGSKLSELSDTVIFQPTPAQKKLKAKFHSRFIPGPLTDLNNLSLSDALEITGDSRLRKLWEQPGFKEWFANRDENRERLEYLFTLALDTAEEILTSETAQASAKVNMVKVLAELANKFPNKYAQEKYVDEEINRMSELQLTTWLSRRGVELPAAKPRNIESIEVIDAQVSSNPVTQKD